VGHRNVTLSVPEPAAIGLKPLEHSPLLEATGQMDDVPRCPPFPFDPEERQHVIEWVAHSTPTLGFARNPHRLICQLMPLTQLLSAKRQLDELDLQIEHLRQPPMVLDDTIGFARLLRGSASFIYPTE
jgi:hypothetical protein